MTTPFNLENPEGWENFCVNAGMKTQGLAYKYAQFDGLSIAEAVNNAIAQVVADMFEHDVPMEAIASYFQSHMDYRPQLMKSVVLSMNAAQGLTNN